MFSKNTVKIVLKKIAIDFMFMSTHFKFKNVCI